MNTFLQLAIGLLIAYRAIAKDNQIPFRANCMQDLRNAWNAYKVNNIALGELNLKFKKWRQVLKFCLPSAVIYLPMRAFPTLPPSGRSNLLLRCLYLCSVKDLLVEYNIDRSPFSLHFDV